MDGSVVNSHGDRKSPKLGCSLSKWPFYGLFFHHDDPPSTP